MIGKINATLGVGDGLDHALARAGLDEDDIDQVIVLISQAASPRDIRPGTVIELKLGRRLHPSAARPLDELGFRARVDLNIALERSAGRLALFRKPIPVDETPLRFQGRVGGSLYLAARATGASEVAVQAYIKALGQRVPIGSVSADDRLDMIVAHRRAATGETQSGELLYAGLHQLQRDLRLMRWGESDQARWFDSNGIGERRTGTHRRSTAPASPPALV